MSNSSFLYPPMPQGVDEKVIQPSAAFKSEVFKVAGAILFFMVVYVVLVIASCGLAALCALGGILLVTSFPKFLTLMIGLGLVGVGLMVIFFLLKFIFKRNKTDRSGLVELNEREQPELFAFIRQLTTETQTPFPKKIYLSADVNASVFYDSSFWSMFLPVRKNLQIGLGLVNSVNLSEFKAILAHEFGHFSQRSMKLGSYVYNVNKVIHNMLYDNEGYGELLGKWASVSDYFLLFAKLTVKVVQGIQWVLQQVYKVVNKRYLSLSRQMEFHADSVAAYVSGSDHLITSLHRLQGADMCYNKLFNRYNAWYSHNLKPDNIYPQHSEVMNHFAEHFNIPVEHGLLQMNAKSLALFNRSRIVVEDQWASHPSNEDREHHLRALNIESETFHQSAWSVFRDAEQLQKRMTEKIYEQVEFKQAPNLLTMSSFREKYFKEVEESSFQPAYQGYYDDHIMVAFELEKALAEVAGAQPLTFEELFTQHNCHLPGYLSSIQSDMDTIHAIRNGETDIKTFDFDGKRYTADETYPLLSSLEKELAQVEEKLVQLDKQIFVFFHSKATERGQAEQLISGYQHLFTVMAEADEDLKRYQAIMQEMNPLYAHEVPFEQIHAIIRNAKAQEAPIKERLAHLLNDESYQDLYDEEQKAIVLDYLSKDRVYFREPSFDNDALKLFNEAMSIYAYIVTEQSFKTKKEVLSTQLNLLN